MARRRATAGAWLDENEDFALAVALFVHAGRIFQQLGSAYATAPAAAIARLQDQLGADYSALRTKAETTAWEKLVPLS